jgi:hypothetical protein
MLQPRIIGWATVWMFVVLSARAQTGPASGLYRIVSGRYTECCGLAGPFVYSLPDANQSFVEFIVDTVGPSAQMKILAADGQTVFAVLPCPAGGPIGFSFDHGLVFSNRVVFRVDPGPPPYQKFWNYTVSNSADSLRIDGILGTVANFCADVPTQFKHTNVVAILVSEPAPVIDRLERGNEWMRFHFTGPPPNDYTVEYTDSLAAPQWQPLATYRAKLTSIDILVTNSFTNASARFFRLRREPCNCD